MDYSIVGNSIISQLKHFITHTLKVDIPLQKNNPGSSVQFNFENLDTPFATTLAYDIICSLLSDDLFWVCEYGSNTGKVLFENCFFKTKPDIAIIPYYSELIDREWFEYECDSIFGGCTTLANFNLKSFIAYGFRLDYLSNTIFLIDIKQEIAVWIYDRRGMDIASTNHSVLQILRSKYAEYIAK